MTQWSEMQTYMEFIWLAALLFWSGAAKRKPGNLSRRFRCWRLKRESRCRENFFVVEPNTLVCKNRFLPSVTESKTFFFSLSLSLKPHTWVVFHRRCFFPRLWSHLFTPLTQRLRVGKRQLLGYRVWSRWEGRNREQRGFSCQVGGHQLALIEAWPLSFGLQITGC